MQNKELYEQFKTLVKDKADSKSFEVIPISNTNHNLCV